MLQTFTIPVQELLLFKIWALGLNSGLRKIVVFNNGQISLSKFSFSYAIKVSTNRYRELFCSGPELSVGSISFRSLFSYTLASFQNQVTTLSIVLN